jgi:TetR/AcrR family transcriptional repressor of lmrAB and yxaGH operons
MSSRDLMIRTMALLLHRQGYAATGLNQMLEESSAPRGSLYFHFRDGKRQLAAEAIAFGGEATARAIGRILDSTDDTVDAFDALIEFFGRRLAESDWQLGCALATVTLETAAVDEQLADACRAGFALWIDPLQRRLVAAGIPEDDAGALATLVLAVMEGGLILARAQRDLQPLEQIRREITALLRARLPARRVSHQVRAHPNAHPTA